ncbi:hypothetical protein HF851_00930 [Corynebacterium ammoniagenes]|uniref:hypothetical protein n=1 Tax=Corynebacterium ammoniagenes TaxID=1697 RepID=UPI001459525F|nr:hypothetical protein [Corynebacterium ammoniagenes]NMF30841.1 hypothetical protein [Corynebacterium ammoniagenes]
MKLFSRKALVAGATAVAVAFAGTSVASADEAPENKPAASSNPFSGIGSSTDTKTTDKDAEDEDTNDDESTANPDENDPIKEENKGSSFDNPKELTAWISVFTAVIGALGALFSFAGKYLK